MKACMEIEEQVKGEIVVKGLESRTTTDGQLRAQCFWQRSRQVNLPGAEQFPRLPDCTYRQTRAAGTSGRSVSRLELECRVPIQDQARHSFPPL